MAASPKPIQPHQRIGVPFTSYVATVRGLAHPASATPAAHYIATTCDDPRGHHHPRQSALLHVQANVDLPLEVHLHTDSHSRSSSAPDTERDSVGRSTTTSDTQRPQLHSRHYSTGLTTTTLHLAGPTPADVGSSNPDAVPTQHHAGPPPADVGSSNPDAASSFEEPAGPTPASGSSIMSLATDVAHITISSAATANASNDDHARGSSTSTEPPKIQQQLFQLAVDLRQQTETKEASTRGADNGTDAASHDSASGRSAAYSCCDQLRSHSLNTGLLPISQHQAGPPPADVGSSNPDAESSSSTPAGSPPPPTSEAPIPTPIHLRAH